MIPNRALSLFARVFSRQSFKSSQADKRALVSYVETLPFWHERYFKYAHNSKLSSYLFCSILNSLGYSVDLRRYDDLDVRMDRTYDFFLGHTNTFIEIKNKIALKGKAVLLVTGSSPEFGNEAQHIRAEELFRRSGIQLPEHTANIVPSASETHAAADHVLMLGNDFVLSTWYSEFLYKYTLRNNVSAYTLDFGAERPSNYLFLSSTGQVHRGLDVLLEVFAERSDHLHICSSVLNEPDFVKAYKRELFDRPNIHTHGFVDTSSQRFSNILSDCKFVILPTCSEGQSSSVINAMFCGLLPIVTPNAGLPDVSSCGFLIDEISPKAVCALVDRASSMSEKEYLCKRNALQDYVRQFTVEQFKEAIEKYFRETVGL